MPLTMDGDASVHSALSSRHDDPCVFSSSSSARKTNRTMTMMGAARGALFATRKGPRQQVNGRINYPLVHQS